MEYDQGTQEESTRFGLTEAQYARFRKLVGQPAASWPKTLQQRVLAAIEREGRRRDVIEWAIASYVRIVVPKTQL